MLYEGYLCDSCKKAFGVSEREVDIRNDLSYWPVKLQIDTFYEGVYFAVEAKIPEHLCPKCARQLFDFLGAKPEVIDEMKPSANPLNRPDTIV